MTKAMKKLLFTFLALFVLAAPMILAAPMAARAADFASTLSGFGADSFSDTVDAIGAVATSGDPQAAPVIQALRDGRLFFSGDKSIFYKNAAGQTFDAATGSPVATPPADLSPVRTNNRVRSVVQAALGTLTLMAPDPQARLSAAREVFRSRDAATLPALEAAIAKETNASVKRAFMEARAAIIVNAPDVTDAARIEAIDIIKAKGDQDALAILTNLPADASAAAKAAAQSGINTINGELALWSAGQNLWYGISLGSVLLLAAIGLAITFGVMGVINMAHGEMVMIGAYTTYVVQEVIRTSAPWMFDWSLTIALPLAFLVSGAIGVAIERGVIRFLYGRPLETLLATWGLSLILQQLVRTIFGPTNKEVGSPRWMSGAFDIGHLSITYNRLWIIVFAAGVFAALLLALKKTPLGLQMRAVTQNRAMASAMGIRTPLVDALTFGLGSGIAGIAGVALSQIDNVSPSFGQGYIIDSFMVVVFGGVGNLWGTLIGALSLGVANKFLEPYAGAVLGKILILVLIIAFIQKRPRGLFALKGRAVEA